MTFSKEVNPYYCSKNGHFSKFFYLRNIKTRRLKNRKIAIFKNRLSHGFGPKIAIFPTFFFIGNIGQENVFYEILERKNAFLGYKNKKFKKSKNWHFTKPVNPWFWSKNGHFSNFFFLVNIAHENVFYDILGRINAFPAYINKKIKKVEKLTFF